MMFCVTMTAQDFVRTIDGKNYWADLKTDNIDGLEEIAVQDGRRLVRIPVSSVLLIEYMESGLKVLQPDKLQKIPPVAFNDDLESFLGKGKHVYIPFANTVLAQRSGAKHLRELIAESGYWEIVGCDEEADFILEYVFDDKGKDHAYFIISDRMGNNILSAPKVGASDWIPEDAGKESADKMYKRHIKNILTDKFNNKYIKKNIQKQKKGTEKNHNCLYLFRI